MQLLFDLGIGDRLVAIRHRLKTRFGAFSYLTEREPIAALVKSIISCRTFDEVSQAAFDRLIARYPEWRDMAAASPTEIEAVIGDVTCPDKEAVYVSEILQRIAVNRPDFDLSFLAHEPVSKALAWLESHKGVGRKISAATLNFSTLCRPALVIDSHVLRVVKRLGLVSPKAETETAYDTIMPELDDWSADDLSEIHCLLKRLGQVHCRLSWPDCRNCPVSDVCDQAGIPKRRIFNPRNAAISSILAKQAQAFYQFMVKPVPKRPEVLDKLPYINKP